jgi:hypothetical protein
MPFDAQLDPEHETAQKTNRAKLYCAHCSKLITYQDWAISMRGSHEHTVFNPAGMVFTIGCFKDTLGCWATGKPSDQFSWFPNYLWQISLCEGCGKHLGWYFSADKTTSGFFGLILNRLKTQDLE